MQSGLKNTMDTKIPHIIHYCWFGNNLKPKLILKCIDSWKKFHPDWEIREWNENNYDVTKNDYIKEAYAQKKWAFVCDFAGFETQKTVNPGLIFASVPEHPILKSIIEDYSHKKFGELIDGKRIENIVDIVTKVLLNHGLIPDNSFQIVDGIAIYPNSIFCCFNHETQHFETTEDKFMRTLIIIPAYNEEENIVRVIDNLIENYSKYDYVIINDGSTDATASICRKHGYNVVNLPINL